MPRALGEDIYDRLFAGDRRAAARLITAIEAAPHEAGAIVRHIHAKTGRAHIIGITGPPGAGKSTLVDGIVDELRTRGKTVGVIAVDPTSPFTGGALLGDRIRMQKRSTDKEVFIRSMGSRGSLGGLSSATADAVRVLDAMGKDVIIIETVGVGQAEIDIVQVADTTVVVLVPGMGDEIQSIKAGIMEIADVFVVNKADRDGADRTVAEVEMMLMMGLGSEDPRKKAAREDVEAAHHAPGRKRAEKALERDAVHGSERRSAPRRAAKAVAVQETADDEASSDSFFEELLAAGHWYPPILKTVAERGDGVTRVVDRIERHLGFLDERGHRQAKRRVRAERDLVANLKLLLLAEVDDPGRLGRRFVELVDAIAARTADPHSAAEEILAAFRAKK